jgi:hypothetical protein
MSDGDFDSRCIQLSKIEVLSNNNRKKVNAGGAHKLEMW